MLVWHEDDEGNEGKMSKVTPDGKKIARLRKQARRKQKDFEPQISERQLRKVERSNHQIDEHVLVNIASILKVKPSEIILNENALMSEDTSTKNVLEGAFNMELRPFDTGGQFVRFVEYCGSFNWNTDVDPNKTTAHLIEDLLKIVEYYCKTWAAMFEFDADITDEFDQTFRFPELHRMARANELIENLRSENVVVLANKYRGAYYNKYTKKSETGDKIYICFAKSDVKSKIVEIRPDITERMYERQKTEGQKTEGTDLAGDLGQ